jgi:hypothetical protein
MCLDDTYSKLIIGKHLSDDIPIQRDAYRHCLFSFASDGHNIHVGVELHGTCRIQVSADNVNLLKDKIGIIKQKL